MVATHIGITVIFVCPADNLAAIILSLTGSQEKTVLDVSEIRVLKLSHFVQFHFTVLVSYTLWPGLAFVQPPASRTGNRLWRQNSANEPSVMRDLLHGTVYLIIFNPSLTLPVLNGSSIFFCFLHALIIELCNVSRTIV